MRIAKRPQPLNQHKQHERGFSRQTLKTACAAYDGPAIIERQFRHDSAGHE
jgi:hypothetical protein